MPDIDPGATLVCISADEEPHVPSTKITATCNHLVWVSDSSLPVVLNGNDVLCVNCALSMATVSKAIAAGEVASAPGALAEIEKQMGARLRQTVEADLQSRGIQTHG